MKNLSEIINETSINAKKRNVSFAKKMYIKQKPMGNIGSFAIITAENPDSNKANDVYNKKALDSLKKDLKLAHYVWVFIKGHYSGNVEHSLLVFNIKRDEVAEYAGKYEQTSFFYCYPDDNGIMNEYWEKTKTDKPYDKKDNPYKFINKTDIIHNESDTEDNYTVIGGDYKYNIDASVFSSVNEMYSNKFEPAWCDTISEALDWATNKIGYKASVIRESLYFELKNI